MWSRSATIAASILICGFLPAAGAFAQDAWPARPIRMIVPYPTGGGTFFDLRSWTDADWQRARGMIKAQNDRDKADRA